MADEPGDNQLMAVLCPVCRDLYPLIQCRNEHLWCYLCYWKHPLTHCPHCGISYREGVYWMTTPEGRVDNPTFHCIYRVRGCAATIRGNAIGPHIRCCPFRIMPILNLCSKLHIAGCHQLLNTTNISEVQQHLRQHGFGLQRRAAWPISLVIRNFVYRRTLSPLGFRRTNNAWNSIRILFVVLNNGLENGPSQFEVEYRFPKGNRTRLNEERPDDIVERVAVPSLREKTLIGLPFSRLLQQSSKRKLTVRITVRPMPVEQERNYEVQFI